jgi:hypothetical protein
VRRAELLTMLVVVAVAPVHAGILNCRSHTIAGIDARNATGAATRMAGTSRLIKKSLSVCMNPGHGRAWFDAEPEPQADQSTLNISVLCERDRGPWRCEKLDKRTTLVDVERDGSRQTYLFDIPDEMSVDQARMLVRKAYQLAPHIEATQGCGYKPDAPWAAKEVEREVMDLRTAFAQPPSDDWHVVTDERDGSISVNVGSNLIHFRRATENAEWMFMCWDIEIVVT